jgi:glycosyltransferase involved in cell wall biosynthesis
MLTAHYSHLERFLPLCSEVAALSPRLASEWQDRFPFLPSVSVLPLIMDQVKMLDLGVQSEANTDQIVFGFAARLEEGKGPLTLLEAVAKVNREAPVAVARIAGIGPQLLDIKARARELDLGDACELVGHYTEPLGKTAFMESLDVFVLPSLAEGTPNSVIEAMAHGVPIIATEVGGIPDIIGGDAGILVPPGDVNSLAEAMLFLAGNSDLRKHMGVAAKQRYERLFSPRVVLPLILETYERVTRNGNHSMSGAQGNGDRHPWAPE